MRDISIVEMFKAKIHFGHLNRFVYPKMLQYIYKMNNKVSIINLDLTLKLMVNALNFIESLIKNNGVILFVGTKRQATKLVKFYSEKISMPYVCFRWLGGLLTNYKTIKNSVKKLNDLEEDFKKKNTQHSTKKELLVINKRLSKLRLNFNGIKNMNNLPDALFIIDVNYESIALAEAIKLGIPVIGVVDTNSNPTGVNYLIPGNDDSADSIDFYLNVISSYILDLKEKK